MKKMREAVTVGMIRSARELALAIVEFGLQDLSDRRIGQAFMHSTGEMSAHPERFAEVKAKLILEGVMTREEVAGETAELEEHFGVMIRKLAETFRTAIRCAPGKEAR